MSFTEQELEEFKAEAFDLLDVAEKSLLKIDCGEEFRNYFDAVFRSFHNLKGAAGMMELTALQSHMHELENILMQFTNDVEIPKTYISLFLNGIDAARSILNGEEVNFVFENTESPVENDTFSEPLNTAAYAEYFVECEELIERISGNLALLESGIYCQDDIDALYRDIHTLKGTSYLFSFSKLGELTHAMESSLDKVRNGTHKASEYLSNCLFKCLGVIETMIQKMKIGSDESEFRNFIPPMVKALHSAAENLPLVETKKVMTVEAEVTTSTTRERDTEGSVSIRVPTALLDNLMTLMGEMVLVRNQVLQYSNRCDDMEFQSMSKRLNVVTNEIQGEMMKTRMQPIGNVLNKFNRVVRDLSQELKKSINLEIHGAETDLDKSLLEAIKDPLTHIVRNSCDHGIEIPEIRKKSGKQETGSIVIQAYHEGGQVVIEITDDGKGLHKDVLVNKAIEKNLLTPEQAKKLSDKEIFNLIFAPGFSTASQITNVSGRGVGMDVVKTNIEQMGGTVDVSGVPGSGTCIKIKIPLTLAIIPALIVKCGQGTFAIPQVKLEGLVRIDPDSQESKIEIIHGSPVLRLRGNLLPLVDLNKVLQIGSNDQTSYNESFVNIAVLNGENCRFGVIIDEVQDTTDIVVKPLNRLLKTLQIYSGATILGDGSVALIFDVMGISKAAQIGSENIRPVDNSQDVKKREETQEFLLVKLSSPTKHAISLSYVHRLEDFKAKDIEYSGSQRVIRYRDVILPIISASEHLGYEQRDIPSEENIRVVVIKKAGVLYGIEVDQILDVLSTIAELDTSLNRNPCVFGNLNTKEELIIVIDPFEIIANAYPPVPEVESEKSYSGPKILVVEDTPFFRRIMRSVLEERGHTVIVAKDGHEAMHILNNSDDSIGLIISDIEMPKMNGFQLATSVRKHPKYSAIPLLAVSSRADKAYRMEGSKAGFDIYLEKFKPQLLLAAVSELTQRRGNVA